MWTLPKLKTGDVVEVRSKEEILTTLDTHGTLAGMPFMPEMLRRETPSDSLKLELGELARVKQANEIAATLNVMNKNRGMLFDAEETPYCGKTFLVRRRVTKIIDERSGRMLSMRTPCVTLEGVVWRGHYSEDRLLCPRAITPYWRENWLERAERRAPR
jgi:hypothetical protein